MSLYKEQSDYTEDDLEEVKELLVEKINELQSVLTDEFVIRIVAGAGIRAVLENFSKNPESFKIPSDAAPDFIDIKNNEQDITHAELQQLWEERVNEVNQTGIHVSVSFHNDDVNGVLDIYFRSPIHWEIKYITIFPPDYSLSVLLPFEYVAYENSREIIRYPAQLDDIEKIPFKCIEESFEEYKKETLLVRMRDISDYIFGIKLLLEYFSNNGNENTFLNKNTRIHSSNSYMTAQELRALNNRLQFHFENDNTVIKLKGIKYKLESFDNLKSDFNKNGLRLTYINDKNDVDYIVLFPIMHGGEIIAGCVLKDNCIHDVTDQRITRSGSPKVKHTKFFTGRL